MHTYLLIYNYLLYTVSERAFLKISFEPVVFVVVWCPVILRGHLFVAMATRIRSRISLAVLIHFRKTSSNAWIACSVSIYLGNPTLPCMTDITLWLHAPKVPAGSQVSSNTIKRFTLASIMRRIYTNEWCSLVRRRCIYSSTGLPIVKLINATLHLGNITVFISSNIRKCSCAPVMP